MLGSGALHSGTRLGENVEGDAHTYERIFIYGNPWAFFV